MRVTLSFDDGHQLDLKVIELLKKYSLPAIFFVPISSWGFENLEKYESYEIGGHTWSHPSDLKKLDDKQLRHEIVTATHFLSRSLNKRPRWFCYPRGRYNEKVIGYVKEAGYELARTTKIGWQSSSRFEIVGYHCYQRKEYNGASWLEFIRDILIKKPFNFINVWAHSWEIEKYNEWNKLESLFKFIYENQPT